MKTRDFLIVFLYHGPHGMTYHNCWVTMTGLLNQKGILKAAQAAGLPENVTVVCIQEMERE